MKLRVKEDDTTNFLCCKTHFVSVPVSYQMIQEAVTNHTQSECDVASMHASGQFIHCHPHCGLW